MRRTAILGATLWCLCAWAAVPVHSQQVVFPDETFAYDEHAPAAGAWLGNLTPPTGTSLFAALIIERDDAGRWSITLTSLWLGAMNTPCARPVVTDRQLAFTLAAPAAKLQFEGEISDDGQRLTGSIRDAAAPADNAATGAFTFRRLPRPMDLPNPLAFTGQLELPGSIKLTMTIALTQTPGGNWVGHVDVPMQQLFGYPLTNIAGQSTDAGTLISATMPVAPPATIEATIDQSRQRLTGRFLQKTFDLPIDFARERGYAGGGLNRPQHPTPPFPYDSRRIVAKHPDGHVLVGTLTIPDPEKFGPGPFPTAVLITGSGGQDRDETVCGHKPFLVIADYLTRRGIAVMRYDDRGIGESEVPHPNRLIGVTTADLATDTRVIVNHLKTLDHVDPGRIGLIGHSEGGIIAPMVARGNDDIAFIVMLAGTAVRGDELLILQLRKFYESTGVDEEQIAEVERRYRAVADLIIADAPNPEIEDAAMQLIRAQARAMNQPPPGDDAALAATAKQFTSLPVKFMLSYNPRPALRALKCPVLALNGTLDLQVWHDQNLPVIERTIKDGRGDVTIKRYEGLNHLFQPAETGMVTEYATIETTIDERVLADIVKWIKKKVGAPAARK